VSWARALRSSGTAPGSGTALRRSSGTSRGLRFFATVPSKHFSTPRGGGRKAREGVAFLPGGGQLLGSQHFSSQCREALSARWCSESEDWKHRDWDSGQRGFYFMFGEYACRRGDTSQRAR
jgi:hypothetical protein